MITQIESAFLSSVQMFRDGIEKIPDDAWMTGPDDYLVPARLAHHILFGLELLMSRRSFHEHIKTSRYRLDDWKGPLEHLPGRQQALEGLDWITARLEAWFTDWVQEDAARIENPARMEMALYVLRHTEHHLGEFAAAARLLHLERPAWIYLKRTPAGAKPFDYPPGS